MSILVAFSGACPDVIVTELPRDEKLSARIEECEKSLLACIDEDDDCQRCSRKKPRHETTFDAYPNNLPASTSFLSRPSVSSLRGCRKLIALALHCFCCARSRRKYQLLTRYRYSKQKKPFSSISVAVEQLTSETYDEEDLAGIPDILESIKLQATGPTEAARAIRKKLKYGSVHRQLRALTILDGLLQNGPQRMQRTILSDGPLLERLRIAAVDQVSDPDVRAKCKDLFSQWVASSATAPGLEGAKSLYNQLPKRAKTNVQRQKESRVLRETEEEAHRDRALEEESYASRMDSNDSRSRSNSYAAETSSPNTLRKNQAPIPLGSSGSFLSSRKEKNFDLNKEKPAILQSIASASVATTNLNNALKLVNREHNRVADDPEVMKRFETCKSLRRQVLRYIHYVEQEEFLGGLIHANDELVAALIAFEVLDKSVDDDSDSEVEEAMHLSRQAKMSEASSARDAEKMVAGLSLNDKSSRMGASPPTKPPRPGAPGGLRMPPQPAASPAARRQQVESESESASDEDEDDPFGDSHASKTPDWKASQRKGYFKEV
ncbi:LAS seventeen-binding protein 5 [Cyphellophora attinorum]|uniref:LAS seventeen-binding protein 5 n=1 Tax=Cyphellophora attinorum TaxID=1664694 RepID=A0A0N1GWT2_9EURO|nr:LAS seventeen-binding protein 5 [Phialophora attinorum]KPI34464.1 LAS seventeen-binding protein 5 [Phialophora attinorum]